MISLRHIILKKDIETIYDFYEDSRNQSLIFNRVNIKSFEEFCDWFSYQLNNRFHEYRIIEEDNNIIGFCYSYDYNDGIIKTALGLLNEKQNHGLGALAELLFFEELFSLYPIRKIYNHVYSYNVQSYKAHLDAGCTIEGQLKDFRYYNGKYHDLFIFSITREHYENNLKKLIVRYTGDENA